MVEAVIALTVVVLVIGGLLWAGGGKTLYEAHGSGIIEAIPHALEQASLPGETLSVVSYAMGYALGGAQADTRRPAAATVYDRLDAIVDMLAGSEADIVLLQEVDFCSRRTHFIDQLHYIAEALGWGFAARVITWECRYLPSPLWPPGRWAGPVRAGQGVLSRYPLMQNTRQRLSQSGAHPLLAPLFAPHHMVQMVDVQCGARTVRVLNTHVYAAAATTYRQQAQELVAFACQVATPHCVLMGALPGQTEAEPILPLITGQLKERLRPVGSLPSPSSPIPPAFVGPGLGAVATHVLTLAVPDVTPQAYLLHLQWALPLTSQAQQQDHHRG